MGRNLAINPPSPACFSTGQPPLCLHLSLLVAFIHVCKLRGGRRKNKTQLSEFRRMEQKQKLGSHLSLSILENNTTSVLEQEELMKLTKVSKEWDFTCTFCFKKFATAQAMGGHQNAHPNERLEEKRLYVRDPIGYRKRAYLRAMQGVDGESSHQVEGSGEKELDPTAYKKRAYLSEMQAKDVESPRVGDSNNEVIEDAHSKMVNRKFGSMNTPPKTL